MVPLKDGDYHGKIKQIKPENGQTTENVAETDGNVKHPIETGRTT